MHLMIGHPNWAVAARFLALGSLCVFASVYQTNASAKQEVGGEVLSASPAPYCAEGQTDLAQPDQLPIPQQWESFVELVDRSDPEYAAADRCAAQQPPGSGGVAVGNVVRVHKEWRIAQLGAGQRPQDFSGWFGPAPLRGTLHAYRSTYAICEKYQLNFARICTLQPGAVVVIGPGQSVSNAACCNANRDEHYPANPSSWQIYISHHVSRENSSSPELVCKPSTAINPIDIGR